MGKFQDLTGKRFGRLTVIKRSERKGKNTYWICRCDCGAITEATTTKLKKGHTKSCGCYKTEKFAEYIDSKKHDLLGKKFGKLTVIKDAGTKNGRTQYLCKCDCGNEIVVYAVNLEIGKTKSCGCLKVEEAKSRIKPCEYEIDDDGVVHVILRSGEEMLCDPDDWMRLKEYGWRMGTMGYAICMEDGKHLKFHIEVMGRKKGFVIDHRNRNRLDNRKCNLRFVTQEVNTLNRSVQSNNQCGIKGVYYDKERGKWASEIRAHGKKYHLGRFETIEEAKLARDKAEEMYHKPIIEEAEQLLNDYSEGGD